MRSSIKALFPDRDCFALVRPLMNEKDLAIMDTLPLATLRSEFQQVCTYVSLQGRWLGEWTEQGPG